MKLSTDNVPSLRYFAIQCGMDTDTRRLWVFFYRKYLRKADCIQRRAVFSFGGLNTESSGSDDHARCCCLPEGQQLLVSLWQAHVELEVASMDANPDNPSQDP